MARRLTLREINAMPRAQFVAALGALFEQSPWIAELAHERRPFANETDLLEKFRDVVRQADRGRQLELLRAHPQLGMIGTLSAHSEHEQRGAGLLGVETARREQLAGLNRAYEDRFGFPFIVAVKGMTPTQVIEQLDGRFRNDPEHEFHEGLEQVCRIAALRLEKFLGDTFPAQARVGASGCEPFTICGALMHTPIRGQLEVREHAVVAVNEEGCIERVSGPGDAHYERDLATARAANRLIELQPGQYLLPGMVDLHIHAPQWPQMGKALHLPLEQWLREYTFPLEARYSDLDFARRIYESLVGTLLANGTTPAVYFATLHREATQLLAEICLARGQRALVGKVAMDNPAECPEFYRDASARQGLDDTRRVIEHIRGMPGNSPALVAPVVTPRFIPSCTDEMLTGLGAIAAEYECHVQTHCSESDWENDFVLKRHGVSDTQSLDRFRLLTRRTVLAHANLVGESDMNIIARCGSGIAHCPLSNFYLSNAVFPARRALDAGLHVGLGTDIAGGPSASLLRQCAHAVTASRVLEEGVDPALPHMRRGVAASRIDFREAFWMATAGGGEALDLKIGRFATGYDFDALLFDATPGRGSVNAWPELDSWDDVLQKIVYNGGPENIRSVWVRGRRVAGR